MNKYYLIYQVVFISIMLSCFLACNQESDICQEEDIVLASRSGQILSLKAPNGKLIAPSIMDLKKKASEIIGERFGVDKEFRIVEVNYLEEIKDGYAAFIEYETKDGIRGNYVISNSPELKFNADQVVMSMSSSAKIKSRSESGGGELVYTYRCLARGICTQSECILVGQGMTISCKCAECALKVSQR